MPDLPEYAYNGARVLVELHAAEMQKFVATWREAKAAGVALPETSDPSYASHEELLRHVVRAARGYMTWMCSVLGLPDPGIEPVPEADVLPDQLDAYLGHVLDGWREPLAGVAPERFDEEHKARWKVTYCVDSMLEHAVMHPIRHRVQLEALMGRSIG